MKIQIASIADAALLSDLARKTFCDTFAETTSSENLELYLGQTYSPSIQAQEIENPALRIFILWDDQTPTGFAQIRFGVPHASVQGRYPIELARLYVDRPHHGRGHAHILMKHCVTFCQLAKFETLWLGVWEHNYRAQKFYQKWKFNPVGSHIFPIGNDPQIDLILEKNLKGL